MRIVAPPTRCSVLLLAALAWAVPASAIDIDNFTSPTNDRFADDPGFIADFFDLSGVGISSSYRWVALVSRNVFVSADHFHPAEIDVVTFYRTNDPLGESVTIGVADGEGMQVGNTDIWLGVLDEPVPPAYQPFPFATEDVDNFADLVAAGYGGASAYLFGRSPSAFPDVTQDVAVGRNVLDAYLTDVSVAGNTGDAILATDNEVGGETYEALLQVGDSSAPLLVETEAGLVLVGTNWIVANVAFANASGFTYLGNHDEVIQDFVDAHPLPEPSVSLALLAGIGALAWMRPRSSVRRGSPPAAV